MKRTIKLFGFIALVAVMTFAMIACSDGGGSPGTKPEIKPETASYVSYGSDGKTYELVIKEAVARYTAKEGDSYVLTIYDPDGTVLATSSGKVGKVETNADANTFELKHDSGNIIKITVAVPESGGSNNTITDIKAYTAAGTPIDTIPVDAVNGSVPTVNLPAELTPTKPDDPGTGDFVGELTDWEYVTNVDGTSRITLYLDGIMVPVTPRQQRVQRAMNPEIMSRSHDYFEAVFVSGDGAVARASWEIGNQAGIKGIKRGIDYGSVYPTTAGASVLFVGRKASSGSGTLLDIGHLIEVREKDTPLLDEGSPARNSTVITANTTSVTFAVYPLTTRVGFTGTDTVYGTDDTATFRTATGDTANYSTVSAGNTKGGTVNISGGNFPVYTLPDITGATLPRTVSASYRFGGLAGATGTAPSVNKPDLATSARILVTTSDNPVGLEILKIQPKFILNGVTYSAIGAVFDQGTAVTTTSNQTHLAAFDPVMTMTFKQNTNSAGIFAITFQVPVCAITNEYATNGGPNYVKWYIRPAHGQSLYLLDNGTDMGGGMVMLRTGAVGSDWSGIFEQGQTP